MWQCAKCKEHSPDTFKKCWRCEAPHISEEVIEIAEPLPEEPQSSDRVPLRSSTPPPIPQKNLHWEYLFLAAAADSKGVYRISEINTKKLPHWESQLDIASYCNLRGTEGWEILSSSFVEKVMWLVLKKRR